MEQAIPVSRFLIGVSCETLNKKKEIFLGWEKVAGFARFLRLYKDEAVRVGADVFVFSGAWERRRHVEEAENAGLCCSDGSPLASDGGHFLQNADCGATATIISQKRKNNAVITGISALFFRFWEKS